ncbi:hypothetical protein RN001_005360 [Aquatica leii]|uniref:O-acyltransferase WSD1 C-terminal domain-containing protein n=1 Tax=Aquatica leii TaxID=1421715 RepID=A0AAN7PGJ8_9COLE|nr:hypothetical protein RN001_005360 [Aquatica leii]
MNAYITVLGYWITLVLAYVIIAANSFIFKKENGDVTTITWKSLVFLFIVLLLSPSIIVFVPFVILYRQLVHKILAFKCAENYGGLLNGGDTVHIIENVNESKIKVLFMVGYEKNNSKSFYNHVKEKIMTSKITKCAKTSAVFRKSYGYYYYVKNQVNIEDCIKQLTLPGKYTKTEALMEYLEATEDIPFPENDFGLWDVFIGTHPVNWKTDVPDKTYYPVLLRFHHSLFDGYHLITTVFGNFSDLKVANGSTPKLQIQTNNVFRRLYMILRKFCAAVAFPWRVFLIINANNSSVLCKAKLQNKKIFSHCLDRNKRYMQVVKEIKQSNGVSFTDVILAAISSSFSEYILKNSTTDVTYTSIATPEVPQATDLLISPHQSNDTSLICKNVVYFSVRHLPIYKNINVLERLNLVKNQGGFLKSSYQIMVDYYIFNFLFATFPYVILKKILKRMRVTAVVTNLPGPPKTTCLSGNILEDILMWSISKSSTHTGISIVILTYDGQLQISLTVDKAVISCKHDVDSILSNIYKGLDKLHQEISGNNNSISKRD